MNIMAFTSSILFLLFIILEKFKKDLFTQKQRYFILKTCLFLLFLPIYHVKPYVLKLFIKFPILQYKENTFYIQQSIINNFSTKYKQLFFYIWIFICVIMLVYNMKKYLKTQIKVKSLLKQPIEGDILKIFNKCLHELNIKRKIKVYVTPFKVTPFTFGIFKPVIILPCTFDKEEIYMILYHELNHIKMNDCFIRFITHIAISIYWFNPFVYFLNVYLEKASEFACDEAVIKNFNTEQCKKYGYCIINSALKNNKYYCYTSSLNSKSNKFFIKQRLEFIMNKKIKSFFISYIFYFCILFIALSTSFVYQSSDNTILTSKFPLLNYAKFIDQTGQIYIQNTIKTYKSCKHNYTSGTYLKHTKDANGNDLIEYYNAYRCNKCAYIMLD